MILSVLLMLVPAHTCSRQVTWLPYYIHQRGSFWLGWFWANAFGLWSCLGLLLIGPIRKSIWNISVQFSIGQAKIGCFSVQDWVDLGPWSSGLVLRHMLFLQMYNFCFHVFRLTLYGLMYAEVSSGNVIWEDSGIHNPSAGISGSFGPCSGTLTNITPSFPNCQCYR